MVTKGQKTTVKEVSKTDLTKPSKKLVTDGVKYKQDSEKLVADFNKIKEGITELGVFYESTLPKMEAEFEQKAEELDAKILEKQSKIEELDSEFENKKNQKTIEFDDFVKEKGREKTQFIADYQTGLNTATTQLLTSKMVDKGYAVVTSVEFETLKKELADSKNNLKTETEKAKSEGIAFAKSQVAAEMSDLKTQAKLFEQEIKNLKEQNANLQETVANSLFATSQKQNASVTIGNTK
jgi:septal ring factor EnvC (AmiA/AmiB activator)